MNALTFELHLTEPLLATQPDSGEENSATSYAFVPGSMLRGALIAAYQRKYGTENFLNDARAQRLFYDGAVRYLNSYPLHVLNKKRMLPLPASWRVDKEELASNPVNVTDFALVLQQHEVAGSRPSRFPKTSKVLTDSTTQIHQVKVLEVPDDDKEYKTLPQPFCFVTSERAERYEPERYLQVHNASDKRNYKDAQSSQVFRYEALAAGEILGSVILVDDGDFDSVRELLGGTLRLGGSHTAGYGRVEIKNVNERADWDEAPIPTRNDDAADEDEETISFSPEEPNVIAVTLLSDVIVPHADFDAALQRALDAPDLIHLRAFAATRCVGGFNRAAGFPLPQAWALRAGSVFVYDVNAFDVEKLRALAPRGLGERTVEGYGRFAVNWQTQTSFPLYKLEPLDNRAPAPVELDADALPKLSATSERLAKEMARRQLRAKLERTLIQKINDAQWKTDPPKNSQLSRVRSAARNGLYMQTLQPIADLLNGLKGARKQYENARVGSQSLWDWLDTRLKWKLETFRAEFKIDDANVPRVGGRAPDVDDALRVEFIARWIDGVMQRGQKLNRDKEGR